MHDYLQHVSENNKKTISHLPDVSKELAYDMSEVPAAHHQNPWLQGLFSSLSTVQLSAYMNFHY